jgi:hypothetical protein
MTLQIGVIQPISFDFYAGSVCTARFQFASVPGVTPAAIPGALKLLQKQAQMLWLAGPM